MTEPKLRLRVLVAESDDSVRRVLCRALAPHFEVTPLGTGASALGRLSEERFDVIVLDLGLADVSALEVLRVARTRDAGVPIVVTSARPSTTAELPGVAYLEKPHDTAALLEAIERARATTS